MYGPSLRLYLGLESLQEPLEDGQALGEDTAVVTPAAEGCEELHRHCQRQQHALTVDRLICAERRDSVHMHTYTVYIPTHIHIHTHTLTHTNIHIYRHAQPNMYI